MGFAFLHLNANDLKLVTEFYITRLNEFSDHCGVAFCLKTILNANETMNTDNSNECTYVKFDIDKVDEFKNLLSNKMNVINEMLQGVETNTDINSVVQDFTTFMHELTHDVFSKKKNTDLKHTKEEHTKCGLMLIAIKQRSVLTKRRIYLWEIRQRKIS